MATPVLFPKLGLSMQEGTLVRWLVDDGTLVAAEQPIFELSTEKVDAEIEAEAGGILRRLVDEGTVVDCGQPVAWLLDAGEEIPVGGIELPESVMTRLARAADESVHDDLGTVPESPRVRRVASPAARLLAAQRGIDLSAVEGSGPGGRVTEADVRRHDETQTAPPGRVGLVVSPVVAKLARTLGVDTGSMVGTGPGGRVTRLDVERAATVGGPVGAVPESATAALDAAPVEMRRMPIAGMRRVIADRMHQSLHDMAQLTITMRADVTRLDETREEFRSFLDDGQHVPSYTAMIVRAVAIALARHPIINSTIDGDEICLLEDIHIGVAVALPAGLVVPVIRDANRKNVSDLTAEISRFSDLARDGRLGPDDMAASTFTVTSLGGYGIEFFTPIVNPPNVAILGVGAVLESVEWNGGPVPKKRVGLSLSFDHRVVDGAPAAAFLAEVTQLLGMPSRLLV